MATAVQSMPTSLRVVEETLSSIPVVGFTECFGTDEQAAAYWDRVDHAHSFEECWPWLKTCNRRGYGTIHIGKRRFLAHRVSFFLTRRTIDGPPIGVLHTCDNPPCCNPCHNFQGTQLDNMQDAKAKGRTRGGAIQPARGEAHWNAALTKDDVAQIIIGLENGEKPKDIAPLFAVSRTTICDIRDGRTWKHMTHIFSSEVE